MSWLSRNTGLSYYTPRKQSLGGIYIVILMSVRSFVRPSQSLIRYSFKTAEQNFMKLSGIVHYMMPYCTSYFKFLFKWFLGFPRAKQGLCHTKHGGAGGIILWALFTVFLVFNIKDLLLVMVKSFYKICL